MAGLGTQALESPLLDLRPDANRIRRVEAFAAQQFADGFVVGLGFEVDLELLLGSQKATFLAGALLGFGWIGSRHVRVCFGPPGEGMVPVALRAPSTIPSPSALQRNDSSL